MSYDKMAVCYDTQSCIKCFACVISCSTENRMRLQRDYNYTVEKSMVEEQPHLNYLRVEVNEKGKFPNVSQIAAFKHCQHCDNPKCMEICPALAISKKDPYLNGYNDISALPNHISDEIKHFFEVYKQLEGKTTTVDRMLGREDAEKIIEKCMNAYEEKWGK